jgi:hypothetical protein
MFDGDTAVARPASAIVRPVWLIEPRPDDFRWLEEEREDSP